MHATPTLSHELPFLYPNNNWRVQIYESLPNVIFSFLLLLPLPFSPLGPNISLNTLLSRTLQLFSCH